MFTSFEGQTRSRPVINLGGVAAASSSSSLSTSSSSRSHVADRARQDRLRREEQRRLDQHARRIQAFYRGRRQVAACRQAVRDDLDTLMTQLDAAVSSTQASYKDSRVALLLLEVTVRLLFVFRPSNKSDVLRLAKLARHYATGKPVIGVFQATEGIASLDAGETAARYFTRWVHLLVRMSQLMLWQIAVNPTQPSNLLFLELVKQLLDKDKYANLSVTASSKSSIPQQIASRMISNDAFLYIRHHLLAFDPDARPVPMSTASCINIALLLISFSPEEASQPFVRRLLTIGDLSEERLTPSGRAKLFHDSLDWPFWQMLSTVASQPHIISQLSPIESLAVLRNVAYLASPRLSSVTQQIPPVVKAYPRSGADIVALLTVLESCLNRLPQDGGFAAPGKAINEMDVDTSDNFDPAGNFTLSQARQIIFDHICDASFLSHLIAYSTRYAATSRQAMSQMLVALLQAVPSQKEQLLNMLVYSTDATATSAGLIRELWRGYIRSSSLNKSICTSVETRRGTSTTSLVYAAILNTSYAKEWPHVILLAELYNRTLLTLGDDEFFSVPTAGSSMQLYGKSAKAQVAAGINLGSRNPLSLDEVVGLSALIRNVAFALYWQTQTATENGMKLAFVAGTRVRLEVLRKLSTQLLQSIYIRDSRRNFTPQGHWVMVSQVELRSFMESTILDDQAIEAETADSRSSMPQQAGDSDDDEMPRPLATVRRHAPSKTQLSRLSPRLGVLNNIPFVIPFEIRVAIFQQFIANDRHRLGLDYDGRRVAAAATIRRAHIAEDGFATLHNLGAHLKGRLAIRFVDSYGQEEAGIDGGGLFKEFLTSLSKEAFDVNRGLWLENANHELYPTDTSYSREPFQLQWYAFLGRVMGKALYEGILVDVPFAPFFLSKWLGRSSGFDDLASFDAELYRGLVELKNYSGNVEKDLALNFTVNDDDFGVAKTVELVPNGANISVTNENRIAYIYRVSDYRLNKQVAPQCTAFFSGLSDLIDPKWLRMFNQVELALMVGGVETSIDVDDLRHNTVYARGYDESHETIQYFWKVVNEFSPAERKALVKFATSCPRPPLLGFGQLNPKFAIGMGGADESRLPSASTCVNLLKLPSYSSPDILREKLRASIHSGAGFDLS